MAGSSEVAGRSGRRALALIGLGGAVLSGIGDLLILGRSCSGQDFDRAAGAIPPHIEADNRWRSLWNGATLAPRRVHVGTLTGLVGIGLLQWLGLRGVAQAIHPGVLRRLAAGSATAFAVSGVLTHVCCGTVILAYRRASEIEVEPTDGPQPSPRSVTTPLAVSAVGALSALAAFSGSLTVAALRRESTAPASWAVVTPFPCVMSTLLTFGALPAPIGGYARPASMSIGLMVYFAVAAASAERGAR